MQRTDSQSSDIFKVVGEQDKNYSSRKPLIVGLIALVVATCGVVIAVISLTSDGTCNCVLTNSDSERTWSDKRNTDDLKAIGNLLNSKWESAVEMKDAAKLIGRHTFDTIFVRTDTDVKHGKDEVRDLYQNWYDSGVAWKDVDLIDIGTLGPDYLYLVMNGTAYDDSNHVVESGKYVVIFRNEGENGYYGFLKVEILDSKIMQ